ncbi:phosphatase PAP2 family protein [Hyunsoonleella ulvae]|uniref:phosphatase PAP2 family protein n=1 Tax=Hyunsoonleella ulvae TaxID=2799948 RepID=UPI00193AC58E|nr:phosphatase PAP2 family protein [Hyunsoonleella ulvae]
MSIHHRNYYLKPLLIVLFFYCQLGYGQDTISNYSQNKQTKISQLLKHDFKYTLKGVSHSFTRPIYWKEKDFIRLATLLVGTTALSTLDNETNRFFDKNKKGFPKPLRDFGWYFGSPQNYFMANAGLYGFGLVTKNEKIRKTSVLIISSSVTTGVITSLLKSSVGRSRPNNGTYGHLDFELFSTKPGFHSFPSGHTALSITMSHAIAKQFDNTWVKVGIYSIGAIPPITRLVDGAHWLTDVAFSAALSIIVVDSIDKFLLKSKAYSYNKPKKISWNFTISTNQIGFIGSF